MQAAVDQVVHRASPLAHDVRAAPAGLEPSAASVYEPLWEHDEYHRTTTIYTDVYKRKWQEDPAEGTQLIEELCKEDFSRALRLSAGQLGRHADYGVPFI